MARLPQSRIVERATAALNELRVYPTWSPSLDAATPDTHPLFVRALAPPVSDYFIVSIRRGAGVTARFAHHAETGEFLEAEAVRRPDAVLADYVDPIEALGPRLTHPAQATYEVVWRPCAQSTSRFLPFRMFHLDGKPVYVRSDGRVFDQLTFRIKG